MAGSVNKVIIVGNVGKDPKISNMPSGDKIVSFTVATSETWKDKNTGERREKTEWHTVVVFNEHIAKVVESYVKKGAKVYVEGSLATRKYTDQNGVEKYSTEIVIQKFKGELTLLDGPAERPAEQTSSRPAASTPRRVALVETDDEVPF